ncbi:MAG TPA: imidazole glycerol phosphate synthase subunit HisF [Candidatus Saccharimonadales bacterium]|nr:imidazole glycerol phosphate synthase subunit HisF [Candidatus Saccharimonadales bacterium]
MLTKRIIPCLDIRDSRVVKGVKFTSHRDAGDPILLAKKYAREGADELVFYDITASSDNRNILIDLVKNIAKEIFIPFTVGGGIRTIEDIKNVLLSGADKVSINTAAVENPELINRAAKIFGSQCIVVGVDSMNKNGADLVYSHTGRIETRKNANKKTIDWVKDVEKRGAGEITINSIDADGTKNGFDLRLLKKINSFLKIPLIASGGAGKLEDFAEVFEQNLADGALAASLFHFNELKINNLKKYLQSKKIAIRN